MTITRYDPNKIWVAGDVTQIGDISASEAITPGLLVERFNNAGIVRFRKRTSVTGAVPAEFALDHAMANKGVDDAYAAGDLVEAGAFHKGAVVWALIASGQIVVAGNAMQPVSGGTLAVGTTNPVGIALENKTNIGPTANMRIRVETF